MWERNSRTYMGDQLESYHFTQASTQIMRGKTKQNALLQKLTISQLLGVSNRPPISTWCMETCFGWVHCIALRYFFARGISAWLLQNRNTYADEGFFFLSFFVINRDKSQKGKGESWTVLYIVLCKPGQRPQIKRFPSLRNP